MEIRSTLALVKRIAEDMQLLLRRPPRQQYAALCYRIRKKTGEVEVLLLTSRDTGRWIIPKGWPMRGKKSHTVAEREAWEEAGVKGKVARQPYGYFTYQKGLRKGFNVTCRVQTHLLEVKDMEKDFPEKGSRQLEWVTCQEAASRVREPELKVMFLRFRQEMEIARQETLRVAAS